MQNDAEPRRVVPAFRESSSVVSRIENETFAMSQRADGGPKELHVRCPMGWWVDGWREIWEFGSWGLRVEARRREQGRKSQ